MAATLVIDDDPNLLESVREAARLSDVDVITAAGWDEGLALFHILSPDLVIADYNMPGSRHGLQLLAEIRRLRPSVRLILVTAYLEEEELDQVRDLGLVDRALTKGTVVTTARAILAEAQTASTTADKPTDWLQYARAYVEAEGVSSDALDELDSRLVERATARSEGEPADG